MNATPERIGDEIRKLSSSYKTMLYKVTKKNTRQPSRRESEVVTTKEKKIRRYEKNKGRTAVSVDL